MKLRKNWLFGIFLFAVTMMLYWPATGFPFVNFDDQLYVYDNPWVVHGLSWNGIKWATTAVIAANWHPLTLLSHMTDCSFFRLFAGGHHLTNILLHSTNAVLLWSLIKRLIGQFWPAAVAAALFAWHPLNVESVAWVSERKNVLSSLFFILTVWTYLRYVERPRVSGYLLTLVLFALGLSAKPMLVTLPFVLLLLDYWPLQRISPRQDQAALIGRKVGWLLLEKVPFLILSVAVCATTMAVQTGSGSIKGLGEVPLALRLFNVPVAYVTYLEKILWPAKLCVFYALPEQAPVAAGMISLLLLVAVTFLAWRWRCQFPWFLAGWLWFLGMLIPVIGLVQTGSQAWADRHAYLPMIGILLIGVLFFKARAAARPMVRVCLVTVTITLLACCLLRARQQLMCWQNSVALFSQAVRVNPENARAQDLLGAALNDSGRAGEAIEHFSAAVRIHPDDADLQYHLGRNLIEAGKFSDAADHLAAALLQMPASPVLHNSLGAALVQQGKTAAAENEFARAIELQPAYSKPYFNLGKTLLTEGQAQPAITNFLLALQFEPDWPEALENLAKAYAATGNSSNAVATADRALKMAQAGDQVALAGRIASELLAYQQAAIAQTSALPNQH
jgi:protein O-mannosyl-transferase